MAHAFKKISAKPTFGNLKQTIYQSDYINNKKSKLTYCNSATDVCKKITYTPSYDNYYLFNNGRYLQRLKNECELLFDKTNLISGLYTKMDLANVCTVIDGSPCSQVDYCSACLTGAKIDINSPDPLYETKTIDPVGELFGNSQCGINNFTHYMKYN
jgi:hypothetical protein